MSSKMKLPVSPLRWASVDYLRSFIMDGRDLSLMSCQNLIKALFGVAGDENPSIYAMTDGLIKSAGAENMQQILGTLTDRSLVGPVWVYTTDFGVDVVLCKAPQADKTNAIELVMHRWIESRKCVCKWRLVTYSAGMGADFGFHDANNVQLQENVAWEDHLFVERESNETVEPQEAPTPEPVNRQEETPAGSDSSPAQGPEEENVGEVGQDGGVVPESVTFDDTGAQLFVREANKMLTECMKLVEQKCSDLNEYRKTCISCLKNGHDLDIEVRINENGALVINASNKPIRMSEPVVVEEPPAPQPVKEDPLPKANWNVIVEGDIHLEIAKAIRQSVVAILELNPDGTNVNDIEISLNELVGRKTTVVIDGDTVSVKVEPEAPKMEQNEIVTQEAPSNETQEKAAEVTQPEAVEQEPSEQTNENVGESDGTPHAQENEVESIPESADGTTPEVDVVQTEQPPLDLEDPTVKRSIVQALFPDVFEPSYNYVKTFLANYLTENGNEAFLLTKTIPTEVTIKWDNITIAIVKMFDGKAYRIYAAKTDIGLQNHDWVSTQHMTDRWHQICPEICLPTFGGNGGFRHGQRYGRRR